jgi:hypothetical protein
LINALCYWLEGRGSLDFLIDLILLSTHHGPGIDVASNRNECQESFWEGRGKGRSALTANLTEICEWTAWKMWEPRRPSSLWASAVCYKDSSLSIVVHFRQLYSYFLVVIFQSYYMIL